MSWCRQGRGWPGRILHGSPMHGRAAVVWEQEKDLPPGPGTGFPNPSTGWWSGVDGAAGAASQLPPTAVPLRGDPAGRRGSVQLWFKQLIF